MSFSRTGARAPPQKSLHTSRRILRTIRHQTTPSLGVNQTQSSSLSTGKMTSLPFYYAHHSFPIIPLLLMLIIHLCIPHVSSDYTVEPDDTHDSAYSVIEPDARGGGNNVSDESPVVPASPPGRSLDLATLRGWGIFLIVIVCLVLFCVITFFACKALSRRSRGLMDRICPGIHITQENQAISAGRCTRINF